MFVVYSLHNMESIQKEYDGLVVFDNGDIYKNGKLLKKTMINGHLIISYRPPKTQYPIKEYVKRIVYNLFIHDHIYRMPPSTHIQHKNGDPADCSADNLYFESSPILRRLS